MDDSLTFENIDSATLNEQNIGGPPMPMYKECQPSITTQTNENLTNEQKHAAFINYVNNDGFVPFDLTQITASNADTSNNIVNNTAFFVFFTMFLLFLIIILVLIVYEHLDVIIGLHLILLISIIIYVMSIIYRSATLSNIKSAKDSLNSIINQNNIAFENSIIQLPNNLMMISNTLNTSSIDTGSLTPSVVMTNITEYENNHKHPHYSSVLSSIDCSYSEDSSESSCSCSTDSEEIYYTESDYQ